MRNVMAMENQTTCLPVSEVSGQTSNSSQIQLIPSRENETGISGAATVAALLNKLPIPPIPAIPERHPRPISVHQSAFLQNDFSLISDPLPENDVLTRPHHNRRHSCPGIANRRKTVAFASPRKPSHRAKVYRWDGRKRIVSDWDGLRRDPELWFEDGDCYVHLHGNGISRRGPSFLIPFEVLRKKNCSTMLNQSEAQTRSVSGSPQKLMYMPSTLSNTTRKSKSVHIFFPPPEDASREDSFKWHISTRNFFAFLLDKPLVGENMGQAFVDLQERLQLLRPGVSTNHQDFLDYADNLGYRDFVDCTDLALANLFYAEHYKLRAVWIDAFTHCVGMHDSLPLSPEFSLISQITKALIGRAHHEVSLQLDKITEALGSFLEEDLSPTHLGLAPEARNHLDRFRKLLHDFYSEKFGYWPPATGSFPKLLYKAMHKDFKTLYDYLVDTESSTDLSQQKPASGGICVLQNIINFDKRHNWDAQPHPLPLLPSYTPPVAKPESQSVLRQWKQASQTNKTHQFHTMNAMLAVSTNTLAKNVTSSKIMQTYMQFERGDSIYSSQEEEKLSARDARKIRWLVIYGTLQYLESALRAPKEVRDVESPDYPLCCVVAGHTVWSDDFQVTTLFGGTRVASPQAPPGGFQFDLDSVQPDCQREDYFSSSAARQDEVTEASLPLRLSQLGRSKSVRALNRLSLSARTSRRISWNVKPKQHCPIVLPGYQDGLSEITITPSAQNNSYQMAQDYRELFEKSPAPFDDALPEENTASPPRTPLLDLDQVDQSIGIAISDMNNEPPARSDSTGSTSSSIWSKGFSAASSNSSADEDNAESPKSDTTDDGGLLGGFVPISGIHLDISLARSLSKPRAAQSRRHSLLRRASKPEGFHLSFNAQAEEAMSPPPLPVRRSLTSSTMLVGFPVEDEKPSIPSKAAARCTTPILTAPLPRRERSSELLSALIAPTSRAWDQCKTTLSRPTTSCTDITTSPSAKSAYSFKLPSLKFSTKLDKNESYSAKKEKRFSMPWRR